MLIQNQQRRNLLFSSLAGYEDNFKWKKASKNLHNYIENQKIQTLRLYQSDHQEIRRLKSREKAFPMDSHNFLNLERKKAQNKHFLQTYRSKDQNTNLVNKHKSLQRIRVLSRRESAKNDFGIQTQEEPSPKGKNLVQQNVCLKELVVILEKQILDYSKKIQETEKSLLFITGQNQALKNNISKINEDLSKMETKNKKQAQMTSDLEYIICQLNDKIEKLMTHISELNQKLQEQQKSTATSQKIRQLFDQGQQSLSINSQKLPKNNQLDFFYRNSDSIIQAMESNILLQENQNWSFSGVQLSSFNKTPNKVHGVSLNEQNQKSSFQLNDSKYEQHIQEILLIHKNEINKLKQQVKYYQIQNSMLRRKKQLGQKNKEEIQQLKHKIEKLYEQNKLIKLMHIKKNHQNIPQPNKTTIQSNLATEVSGQATTENLNKQKSSRQNRNSPKLKKQVSQSQKRQSKQNQINLKKQKALERRRSPLQKKFVRRHVSLFNSQSKSDEDSDVSFELSPQRV